VDNYENIFIIFTRYVQVLNDFKITASLNTHITSSYRRRWRLKYHMSLFHLLLPSSITKNPYSCIAYTQSVKYLFLYSKQTYAENKQLSYLIDTQKKTSWQRKNLSYNSVNKL